MILVLFLLSSMIHDDPLDSAHPMMMTMRMMMMAKEEAALQETWRAYIREMKRFLAVIMASREINSRTDIK